MLIRLAGEEYEVRYPFWACKRLEDSMPGRTISSFIRDNGLRAATGDISYSDIVSLLWAGILHNQKKQIPGKDKIAMLLDEPDTTPIYEFLPEMFDELCRSVQSKVRVPEEENEEEKN